MVLRKPESSTQHLERTDVFRAILDNYSTLFRDLIPWAFNQFRPRIGWSEAQDIVQSAFVKVLQQLHRSPDEGITPENDARVYADVELTQSCDPLELQIGQCYIRRAVRSLFIDQYVRTKTAVPFEANLSLSEERLLKDASIQAETVTDVVFCKWVVITLPHFFRRLEHACTTSDREIVSALQRCAQAWGFDASLRDRLEFLHAVLFNDCSAFGLPCHREFKGALCRELGLTPQTVDTRLCRLRRRWTVLCHQMFPVRATSHVIGGSGACKVSRDATLSRAGDQ